MSYPTEADIKSLLGVSDNKLSLSLATHRHFPDNRGDQLLAENKIREIRKFFEKHSISDSENLVPKLESLVQTTNWQQTKDGIVYLVSPHQAKSYSLDHQPQTRFHVGNDFLMMSLCRQVAMSPAVNVLLLSEFPTRFFHGKPTELMELENDDFPVIHEGPGGLQGLPTGFGQMTSIVRDENHRKFFRGIENSVERQLKVSPGPLFVLGVVRYLAFWKEVAPQIEVSGELAGNFDKLSIPQIQDLIRPLVDELFLSHSRKLLSEIEEAFSRKMMAQFSELHQLATESKLAKLIVNLSAMDSSPELEPIIWETLTTGGSIEFIQASEFPTEEPALGLIRYS